MIDLVEYIKPISYVKAHTAEILKQVEEKNNPMIITQNDEAKAVLMNVTYYQTIMNSINLLKILSIGENDIKNNNIMTQDELDKKIEEMLDQK